MPDANTFLPDAHSAFGAELRQTQLPLAMLLDANVLLVVGAAGAPPPLLASVSFLDDCGRADGTWQAFQWSGHGGTTNFFAILRAEQVAHLHAVPMALQPADGGGPVSLAGIERLELDVEPLVDWLRAHGCELAAMFDFAEQALACQEPRSSRTERFLVTLLTAISVHDGFIEIVARPECGGLLMQGWSMHLPAEVLELAMLAGGIEMHETAIAHFRRSDLLSTASGFVAFARQAREVGLQALQHAFFKVDGTYYRLDAVENRVVLQTEHVVVHLLEILERLEGPLASLRGLKRVCRLRFAGQETVSSLTVPVRIACDTVLNAPGAGLFVSGWLLDPKRLVSYVIVKSTRGFYHRIEPTMVRLPRPDINDGFASDPVFAESLQPWDTLHGFMAFVPRTQPLLPDEVVYMEIVLEDESCAFLPLRFHDGDQTGLLHQILGAVNIDDPEIDRLVADHLSPMVTALATAAPRPNGAVSVMPFGPEPPAGNLSVVLPLADGWNDFDINLAHFGADPEFATAELVVVAARSIADKITVRLKQCADFYGVSGRLVLSGTTLDAHDAMALGVGEAARDRILLLSPAVFPRAKGWLGTLVREFDALSPQAALCPTLVYEDHSIRFAGTAAPPSDCGFGAGGRTGYAADWIDATTTIPVWAGTLDCCLMRRDLFEAVGGFASQYLSPQLKALDFALRLKAGGGQFHWAPQVNLYALDDVRKPEEAYWTKVRRLVDERTFERTWGAAIPAAVRR